MPITPAFDPYAILGVGQHATADEIRKQYKRLASENHPDQNADSKAPQRFKEVVEAYSIIGDESAGHNWDVRQRLRTKPAHCSRPSLDPQEIRRRTEVAEILGEFLAREQNRASDEETTGGLFQNLCILFVVSFYAFLFFSDPLTAAKTEDLFWCATILGVGLIWMPDWGDNFLFGVLAIPAYKLLGWVVLIGFPLFVWHASAVWPG